MFQSINNRYKIQKNIQYLITIFDINFNNPHIFFIIIHCDFNLTLTQLAYF